MKPTVHTYFRRTAALSARHSAAFLAAGALLSAPLSEAVVTYSVGDLLLGFHTNGGVGSGTSFVLNVGPAVNYKNDAYSTPLVSDIGNVLTNTFGTDWYSRSDLYWGIAAVRDAAGGGPNTVVNGDAKATIYVSTAASAPGESTPWTLASSSTVVSAATSIATMQGASGSDLALSGGFEGAPEAPNTGGRGVLQDEGTFINSWDEFNPIGGNAFGNILTGGVQGAFGTGQPMTYLDLHRVVGRENANATPNDPVGQGRYITTFTLNSAGIIGTVPEPTTALLLGLAGAAALLRRRRA
ncbi:MAG: PEP-CTERM sorting domain-containing protein [Verrucomicrobiales bacterium]